MPWRRCGTVAGDLTASLKPHAEWGAALGHEGRLYAPACTRSVAVLCSKPSQPGAVPAVQGRQFLVGVRGTIVGVGTRQLLRRLVEPAQGTTRRILTGPARGITFTAEPAATASADMWVGLLESEIAKYIRRFCRPGTVSVDVGANAGYYSLTFAQRCLAPVIAYEPDPAARERLARNLDLNPGIASWIDVRGVAVTDKDGPGSVTLDADLVETARVGLLKIDVDGAEEAILAGARRLLVDSHPDVILETHSAELEDVCARLLIDAGYAPRVITQRRILPQNRPAEHNRWLVADRACRPTSNRSRY